jgi:hypothetical protein
VNMSATRTTIGIATAILKIITTRNIREL